MSDGKVTIRTNSVPRFAIDACELTPTERKQFDYLDWPKIDAGTDSATFVRYQGFLYSLDQFTRIAPDSETFPGWHGIHHDSAFSGVLIRVSDDGESVTMGAYYA